MRVLLAAEKRQAQVEAALEQKAAEAVLSSSGDGKPHLPVAPVYARAVATGSTERDEAFQVIAHILAPDCKLVSKACAIEVWHIHFTRWIACCDNLPCTPCSNACDPLGYNIGNLNGRTATAVISDL